MKQFISIPLLMMLETMNVLSQQLITGTMVIVVSSEPLYWSPAELAVYFSNDAGESWTNIYDNRFGALRWKALGIDKVKGTIYGVTCGNGAFYAKRSN
jgi:hypothetical protein